MSVCNLFQLWFWLTIHSRSYRGHSLYVLRILLLITTSTFNIYKETTSEYISADCDVTQFHENLTLIRDVYVCAPMFECMVEYILEMSLSKRESKRTRSCTLYTTPLPKKFNSLELTKQRVLSALIRSLWKLYFG